MNNEHYSIRLNDPFREQIEWRLNHGEEPYDMDNTPHVLAGDTYLVKDAHGVVSLEIC